LPDLPHLAMTQALAVLLTPKLIAFYLLVASATYVHLRGRVRHPLLRQLTDHSTLVAPYNVLMYFFSAVPNRPFVSIDTFPELSELTDNWQTLRDEGLALIADGHIRAAVSYNDLGFNSLYRRGWKRFFVKWYDAPLPSAQSLCPKTVALVQSIPTVNAAMFALLPPGGDIGRHRDPFAGALRYHLGLATPNSEACQIVVDGEPYFWRDGEGVVFDETFIHWAENRTDQPRLILFCDIERPLTNRVMRTINHWVELTWMRASQTDNAVGDHVGILNRIFEVVYRLRLVGKALKRRSEIAYYAVKWGMVGLILYWILLVH
jgi:beta-hydroxylase